nr:uncharacterized protein LOC104111981 [Nicotiana tomentosiformis]
MWENLEVTYEGTSKVKETHINMLVHDYELFQMKEGKSIEEMFARLSKIIGDLKAFGKPYSSGDQHSRKHTSRKQTRKKKKIVAFKATTERPENDIDDDPEALEEEIAMDILDLTLKESQKMLNELRRLNREKKDWELKLEVCEIKRDVLQDEVRELQMQLNGMRKSTSHSFIKSNQATYKSTGKWPTRTEFTSTNTSNRSKTRSINVCHYCNRVADFVSLIFHNGFGNPKTNLIPVELTSKDPSKFVYLKESDDFILQEHHRKSRKGKWYLDSACSCHMTGDKHLFKEVTKINGGSVKLGDDSKGRIVGTSTVPFNNNYDIT